MKNHAAIYALPLLAFGCGEAADGDRDDAPMATDVPMTATPEVPPVDDDPMAPAPEATQTDSPASPPEAEPMQPAEPAQDEPFDYEAYQEQLSWGCLGGEAPAEREPARAQYQLTVLDFDSPLQRAPDEPPLTVPGLQVFACDAYPECTELPLCSVGDQACYRVDDTSLGLLTLDFPPGPDARVLRFRAPGYVELDYMIGSPTVDTPIGARPVQRQVHMLSTDSMGGLNTDLGVSSVDPQRGMLMIRALDCRSQPGDRVRIEPSNADLEATRAFVLDSLNRPHYGPLLTDWSGLAGLANVVPQTVTLDAVAPTGEKIGGVAIPIRAGAIVLAELGPGLDGQ